MKKYTSQRPEDGFSSCDTEDGQTAPETRISQGESLFALGDFEGARDFFEELRCAYPGDAEILNNLGVISFQRQKIQESIEYFKKVLEIDPFHKTTLINYTDLLRNFGRQNEMVPLLEQAVRELPEDRELYNLLEESRVHLPKQKILVTCINGLQSFLGEIVAHLSTEHDVRTCYSQDKEEIKAAIQWADVVWLEWANELAIELTRNSNCLEGKHVICRLHSYEAFSGYANQILWEKITDLIFVAEHIKEIVLQQVPGLRKRVKNIHVIPNGVNLEKFSFKERAKGTHLAYLGHVNYKKGPMLLLHAFRELVQINKKYKLFIGGDFQDARYMLYFNQMIKEFGLEENIQMAGYVDDVPAWLDDKQYIVCSSVLEGHPVGLMEGMARGLKPVIHNFVGARGIYPDRYLWSTIDDFIKRITEDEYHPSEYRQYIASNFDLGQQLKKIQEILNTDEDPPKAASIPNFTSINKPKHSGQKDLLNNVSRPSVAEGAINFYQPLPPVEIISNRKLFTVEFCVGKRVLHIGCVDAGIMQQRISESNFLHHQIDHVAEKAIGIDINLEGIDRLREAGYDVHRVDIQSETEKLKKWAEEVDVIVIPEVIEHLDNVGMFLDNLKKCCFHGDILISTPNAFSLRTHHMLQQRIELVHPDHTCYYSPFTLTALLRKHGFDLNRLLIYYWKTNDRFGTIFEKTLQDCPYYGEGLIAIARARHPSSY